MDGLYFLKAEPCDSVWPSRVSLRVQGGVTHRALVHFHFFLPEVRHLLEGVDGDEYRADVGLVSPVRDRIYLH